MFVITKDGRIAKRDVFVTTTKLWRHEQHCSFGDHRATQDEDEAEDVRQDLDNLEGHLHARLVRHRPADDDGWVVRENIPVLFRLHWLMPGI